jgi:hypothetical protein
MPYPEYPLGPPRKLRPSGPNAVRWWSLESGKSLDRKAERLAADSDDEESMAWRSIDGVHANSMCAGVQVEVAPLVFTPVVLSLLSRLLRQRQARPATRSS